MPLGLTAAQWFLLCGAVLECSGAVLILNDVVRRFRGERVRRKAGIEHVDVDVPETTPEDRAWDARRLRTIALGLFVIAAGFLLQVIGIVLQP